MGKVDSFAKQLPRLLAAVASTQGSAKIDQHSRVLQPRRGGREEVSCFAEQQLAVVAALHQAERTQRDPNRSSCTPPARELELSARELASFALAVESVQAKCGL